MSRRKCNCGTEFDTDREPVIPGQDTSRCPSCGGTDSVPVPEEPVPDGGDETGERVTVDTDGEALHIHLHVHRE